MSYLSRREGRYHYRRRYPQAVADLLGKSEFRKALGTADRVDALKLARQVSVEFDRICDEALSPAATATNGTVGVEAPRVDPGAVLRGLQAVVERVTLRAVEDMHPATKRVTKDWQTELDWQQRAYTLAAQGMPPPGMEAIHPLEAMAAVRAIEAVQSGSPLAVGDDMPEPVRVQGEHPRALQADSRTAAQFKVALDDYCDRVSPGRVSIMRKLCDNVLRWPSTPAQQVQRIMAYAEGKLVAGGKASSVHTQAAGLITILRELPGWEGISLPKQGAVARAVRAGGALQKNARDPMPLAVVEKVQAALDARGDAVDAAAMRLLVRYGVRPLELLSEGPAALAMREDILGDGELVFQAGLSGAKNAASRRDLPVAADDVPLFKLVLSGFGVGSAAERGRQRVTRLSRAVHTALLKIPGITGQVSLYSARHTAADLLRAAGATDAEVGGILGHTQAGNKHTGVYGGTAPLTRQRELLAGVRELLDKPKNLPAG
ncbi:DUF6538 domain-containing protein [Pseudomonas sediminis]|uniref:Tyr recombinase domain-containing protein n=1 Tax=Pseudomonas sediminis TaxID=1691904 RepID=A0ABX6SD48_9PSED|nr:DUF6538 domain-containing protein [Pseudomonas sediminis]QNG99680.1 hypothetical protein HNQ25_15380 [Pseudomonas sediminis]